VVYRAPTLPDDVTCREQDQWSVAGGSEALPGIVNGKFSEAGLYKLLKELIRRADTRLHKTRSCRFFMRPLLPRLQKSNQACSWEPPCGLC
jgi:hypothetical protein